MRCGCMGVVVLYTDHHCPCIGEQRHTHALTWGIVDVENGKYHDDASMDPTTPMVLTRQLEKGQSARVMTGMRVRML